MSKKHGRRSITFKISMFLIAAMAFQCILFLCFVLFGGMIDRLNQNASDILIQQTITRRSYLENDMVQRWSQLDETQATLNRTISAYLGGHDLARSDLTPTNPHTIELLGQLSDPIVNIIRRNGVTGAFLIFNGSDPIAPPAAGESHSKAGLHYRDMDPDSTPSDNSDLLVERCSSELVRALGLTMDINWAPTFLISEDDTTYFEPVSAALEYSGITASDLGYWSAPHVLPKDNIQVITYSQPLLDENGVPYGIVGVELSLDYLRRQLPYSELGCDSNGAYLLAIAADTQADQLSFGRVVTSGPTAKWVFGSESRFSFEEPTQRTGLFQVSSGSSDVDQDVYGSIQYLNLYNNNTPFEHQRWALIGIAASGELFAFSHSMMLNMLWLSLTLLAVGILLSLVAGSVFARPIRTLAHEVRSLNPNQPVHLAPVNIREIDHLSASIELLSRNVADASSRLSKILELTHIPLAAFQLTPELPNAYYTDSFFPLIGRQTPAHPLSCDDFQRVLDELRPYREEEFSDRDMSMYRLPSLGGAGFYWLQLQTVRVNDATLGVMVDVTQEILEKRRIEYERDHDLLTHLLNRRAFHARLDRLAAAPEQIKIGAMLMMDLDNLKYLNDTYGHDCGDEYIRCAADVLRKFTVQGCLSARMSGDEFYLFFGGFERREDLQQVLDLLQREIALAAIRLPDRQLYRLRASVGVAWYPENSTSLTELIRYADFAMYEAKNAIKGGVKHFDIQSYHQNSFLLYSSEELNRILDEDAVDYVFQPIVTCSTGSILGYEALMRPRSKALPSPLDLLRIARSQSKLLQVERLTWFRSMEAFVSLPDKARGSLVFINSISSLTLTDEDLQQFDQEFAPYLSRIVLELTEGDDSDNGATRKKQSRCEKLHRGLALDDFGTGYSNDSVLLKLRPDFVKLDMSIVHGIDRDKNRKTLFRNLVSLCHGMGIEIIAEGVETAEELATLVMLGADHLQGYYLSRPSAQPAPLPESVLMELHEAWPRREKP